MKNLITFLCILALLTGSLAGCNNDKNTKPMPSATPPVSVQPSNGPKTLPDTDDGVVKDDDGIISPEETSKP